MDSTAVKHEMAFGHVPTVNMAFGPVPTVTTDLCCSTLKQCCKT